ncbi:MAG TPA: hypothetical protein VNS88_01785 [Nitrospiraceae bacterium]|nr:hypothetical protein [Nitrospiraceae bacterium]
MEIVRRKFTLSIAVLGFAAHSLAVVPGLATPMSFSSPPKANITPSDYRSDAFSLASLVPKKNFAVLGEGAIGGRKWGAFVYRASGGTGGREPCLFLASAIPTPASEGVLIQSNSDCGMLAPPARRPLEEQSGASVQVKPGGANKKSTVIALVLGPDVRVVEVKLGGGGTRRLEVRRLNSSQGRKAHVAPITYVTMAIARKTCVEAVSGFGANGEVLVPEVLQTCEPVGR